jgi:hypothetical protein
VGDAFEFAVGDIFSGCRIEELVGRGGMGVVYRARHLALDIDVAIKVILPQYAADSDYRDRFLRERKSAARVRHEHVIRALDGGEQDGRLYVVMDFVRGQDLNELIRNVGPLPAPLAAEIVSQVADALDAVHGTGLIHRDVKPANVLVERRVDGPFAYLADFGLARQAESASRLTRTGILPGSVAYMAPEQFLGQTPDKRSDIYALGCVLYQALTARLPFEADSDGALLYSIVHDPIPTAPQAPAPLNEVIKRALAKKPDDRYQSAGALGSAALAAAAPAKVEANRAQIVRDTLQAELKADPSLADEPRRALELLTAKVPQYKLEIALLEAAVAADVLTALRGANDHSAESRVQKLARTLTAERGLEFNHSEWAVRTWAIALGLPVRAQAWPPVTLRPTPLDLEQSGTKRRRTVRLGAVLAVVATVLYLVAAAAAHMPPFSGPTSGPYPNTGTTPTGLVRLGPHGEHGHQLAAGTIVLVTRAD